MKLEINLNWTYKEILTNLKMLKDNYHQLLASFSIFEVKEKAIFIHETRDQFYSLKKCSELQIEHLWNMMNYIS